MAQVLPPTKTESITIRHRYATVVEWDAASRTFDLFVEDTWKPGELTVTLACVTTTAATMVEEPVDVFGNFTWVPFHRATASSEWLCQATTTRYCTR